MPQLDKVTLFSQVFWLILLYFLFFLAVLRYYLPKFSKVFRVRDAYSAHATTGILGVLSTTSDVRTQGRFQLVGSYSQPLHQHAFLLSHNLDLLGAFNKAYVLVYAYACLKYKLYKNLYL